MKTIDRVKKGKSTVLYPVDCSKNPTKIFTGYAGNVGGDFKETTGNAPIFEMNFVVDSCSRGRSSADIILIDVDTDVKYYLGLDDAVKLCGKLTIGKFKINLDKKYITGIFTVKKRGSNYKLVVV